MCVSACFYICSVTYCGQTGYCVFCMWSRFGTIKVCHCRRVHGSYSETLPVGASVSTSCLSLLPCLPFWLCIIWNISVAACVYGGEIILNKDEDIVVVRINTWMHLGVPKFIIELKLIIKQNPKGLVSLLKHKTLGNFWTISVVHPKLMFLVFGEKWWPL